MLLTKQTKFVAAIALQVAIIFAIIIFKVLILSGGTDIMLRIEPVDPRDMLRGDYVTFRYSGVSLVNQYVAGAQQARNGSTVYVVLRESGKYWTVQSVQSTRPLNGEVVLKGKVVRGGMENQATVVPNQRSLNVGARAASSVEIVYGIEEYFIPEGTGQNFSFFDKEVVAKVAVDTGGNAVLKQIYVDGKPFEQASTMPVSEETALVTAERREQLIAQADDEEASRISSQERIETAAIADADAEITIDSPSAQPVAVAMHVVRALKLIPGSQKNSVALRTCSVAGCLPEHDVSVGVGEAIIKLDVEFMNTRTSINDPGTNNAYFRAQAARFSVDGIMMPVLELRQSPSGNWVISEPSFYIEPMKKHQQTFFVRVPKEAGDVKLVYGPDLSQPDVVFQACFTKRCTSGFLKPL